MPAPAEFLLNTVNDAGRTALTGLGRIRRYRPGEFVFREGERGSSVVAIERGRVKVTTTTSDGHEVVLAIRGPGDLVGELSCLAWRAPERTATVTALNVVVARVIRSEHFLSFLEEQPRALLALTRSIIDRLHDADRRRLEFGAYGTLGRVARVLNELVEHGRSCHDGVELDPPLTQNELAGLVGASRESVVRALAELRRRGVVETGRRRLVVRDVDALAGCAADAS